MPTKKQMDKTRRRRAFRVRGRVRGTAERPRITVHRTLQHTYAQVIDDESGRTLCSSSTKSLKVGYGGNVDAAKKVGEELGRKAKELNIEKACFDRGRYAYHGRIKAIAEAVRAAGIQF